MEKKYSAFTIASVYIGTVVGAGFASGQEVLQFFGFFGGWGFIGIALSSALFIFFGYLILKMGHELKAESFLPVIKEAAGEKIGTLIDIIITFFMFGILVTMLAGAGAIFVEQFRQPAVFGALVMAVISLVTVILGINRVIESIRFVAPILIISILALGLWTIISSPQGFAGKLASTNTAWAAVPLWPLAAILYGSYNLVLAIPVLAPLGNLSKIDGIRPGAILGGLGLGIGALAISTSILIKFSEAARFEVPMIAIAGGISPLARTFYSFVLISEVYTTAVAALFGFVSRLTSQDTTRYRLLAVGTSIVALILAQFGFSNLVGTLFPIEGFAGLLMLGALAYAYLKQRKNALWLVPRPAHKPEQKRKGDPEPKQ